MIRAPSCNGLFLKKMLSINPLLTGALIFSPVCSNEPSSVVLVIIINAPVLVFDILMHASTISLMFKEIFFFGFIILLKSLVGFENLLFLSLIKIFLFLVGIR